jgi:hypothetical protein
LYKKKAVATGWKTKIGHGRPETSGQADGKHCLGETKLINFARCIGEFSFSNHAAIPLLPGVMSNPVKELFL